MILHAISTIQIAIYADLRNCSRMWKIFAANAGEIVLFTIPLTISAIQITIFTDLKIFSWMWKILMREMRRQSCFSRSRSRFAWFSSPFSRIWKVFHECEKCFASKFWRILLFMIPLAISAIQNASFTDLKFFRECEICVAPPRMAGLKLVHPFRIVWLLLEF